MFYTLIEFSIGIRPGTFILVSLPKCDPGPLVLFAMDSDLYASMPVLDVDECKIPRVCENASMSDNPHDCDAMLPKSLGVVDISNIKFLKKKVKKFNKNLSKLFCEKDDLIAKLNESNKLVEKYKKLAENSLEKLKEFECLNMDLDAELVCLTNLLMS